MSMIDFPNCRRLEILAFQGNNSYGSEDRLSSNLSLVDKLTNGTPQSNVLVSDEGRPLICDFGRSKILEVKGFTTTTVAGTIRYMAPELTPDGLPELALDSFVPILTQKSDVYAFGMVGLEVQSFFPATSQTLIHSLVS